MNIFKNWLSNQVERYESAHKILLRMWEKVCSGDLPTSSWVVMANELLVQPNITQSAINEDWFDLGFDDNTFWTLAGPQSLLKYWESALGVEFVSRHGPEQDAVHGVPTGHWSANLIVGSYLATGYHIYY